jgi:hypothetical protein
MSARVVLSALLVVVAGCAAVLSWSALHDLALVCGFAAWSAPLLPVTVDAGAAAGTLAWLTAAGAARRFGRALALVLLGASVGGNAVGHALAALHLAPPWWLVVAVSAVAPAVLGAVVHLAVVTSQSPTAPAVVAVDATDRAGAGVDATPGATRDADEAPDGDEGSLLGVDEHGLSRWWALAPPVATPPGARVGDDARPPGDRVGVVGDHDRPPGVHTTPPGATPGVDATPPGVDATPPGVDATPAGDRVGDDRVADLIAAGAGRRRVARELGIPEHQARALIDTHRNGHHREVTR